MGLSVEPPPPGGGGGGNSSDGGGGGVGGKGGLTAVATTTAVSVAAGPRGGHGISGPSPPPPPASARPSPPTDTTAVRYAVAPMMDVTDRHFRTLARLISRRAVLYTEMVVDKTLIHNPRLRERSLALPAVPPLVPSGGGGGGPPRPPTTPEGGMDPVAGAIAPGHDGVPPPSLSCPPQTQHPVVLQLGGSDPEELAAAVALSLPYGYTEINLNCGCPSPTVAGKGAFGAALMKTPSLVADATRRMAEAAEYSLPITVKCRLGVDTDDSYESLLRFVDTVSSAGGVRHFSIHARAAILNGLSPAQNRSIPPLRYGHVYRLAAERPNLVISLNGGVKGLAAVDEHLDAGVAGVMVGREVMDRPWHALVGVDARVYGEVASPPVSRREVLTAYAAYAEAEVAGGAPIRAVVKPLLGLFAGEANGKRWRRAFDGGLIRKMGVRDLIDTGMAVLSDAVLDRRTPEVPRPPPRPLGVASLDAPATGGGVTPSAGAPVPEAPVAQEV
ncbi:hypothetical protein MMPV_004301 [Pyropia vietnamensis]